ncbi:hypothetical protein BST13_06285 [Mycobacterium aquaticum]|uniref:PknH-like extracellular domain-containing protein n=1 Tax=Mycobacterium aquaticum TaxID=1927124 RepID=A0A1X0B7D4_9MYCO|nr:sensor domain-containing protein [Mycobacterium aquaticum]ORA38193.1 hypothetical protein BST13_06285 [Mycobacterium aquaticum]
MVAEAVMRVPRRGVGKLLRATSAGVVLLALTACTARVPPDPNQPQVDVLGSMMASEAEINTIMGTIDTIRPKTALRAPMKNDLFEPLSRPECIVAIGNAMDWVYRDSGYRQYRRSSPTRPASSKSTRPSRRSTARRPPEPSSLAPSTSGAAVEPAH